MYEQFKLRKKQYRHPLKMYTGFIIFPGSLVAAILIYHIYEFFTR